MSSWGYCSFGRCCYLLENAGCSRHRGERPVLSTRVQCKCQRVGVAAVHPGVTNEPTKGFVWEIYAKGKRMLKRFCQPSTDNRQPTKRGPDGPPGESPFPDDYTTRRRPTISL